MAAIDLNDEQHALVERLAYLDDKIRRLREDRDEVAAKLREHGTGELYHNGGKVVEIKQSYRFDAKQATEILPQPLLDLILVSKPDPAKAKKLLPAPAYDKCLKAYGKPEVKVITEDES